MKKEYEYDLVVVGSGAGGLSAACTAAAKGKRVVIIEASEKVGGTTAISGGMVWIPGNHKMSATASNDLDAARRYLRGTVGAETDSPNMHAFLTRGDEALRFLESHTSLRLQSVQYPDYYPDLPGATLGGRVLEPVPFDGAALGRSFSLLRDPLPEFLLFGGMMVSRKDLPILRRVGRSPRAFWHAAKLFTRYMMQRTRFHRGTTLVLGNALVARLLKSALDLKVDFWLQAQAVDLILRKGAVAGVRVHRAGEEFSLNAPAVVLATGGISHHSDLRQTYVPSAAGNLSATVRSEVTRGGAHLAQDVGAALSDPATSVEEALAFWVPVSRFTRTDGTEALFPHTVTDRAKPGLIAVNQNGQRFVNEAKSYHEFVRAQLSNPQQNIPAWLVCDADFLWRYGLGCIRPFAISVKNELSTGYLKQASTVEDLAKLINVPTDSFAETLRAFNAAARQGRDPQYGRGSDMYQRYLGDVEHQPNPCVGTLARAPFCAVAVHPADLGMAAGILTDEHARVLGLDGKPISGLYTCGNDMHSVMQGVYPGPGITLGPALVFGFIAASHACANFAPST